MINYLQFCFTCKLQRITLRFRLLYHSHSQIINKLIRKAVIITSFSFLGFLLSLSQLVRKALACAQVILLTSLLIYFSLGLELQRCQMFVLTGKSLQYLLNQLFILRTSKFQPLGKKPFSFRQLSLGNEQTSRAQYCSFSNSCFSHISSAPF